MSKRGYTAPFADNILECYFANEQNTIIEVIYLDGDKRVAHALETDPEHPDFIALEAEGWTLDEITKATINRNRGMNTAVNHFINYYLQIEKEKLRADFKKKHEEVRREVKAEYEKIFKRKLDQRAAGDISKESLLATLLDLDRDEDAVFKFKLAIFELPEIKAMRNRSGKMKVRKAKTLMGTIAALNELMEGEEET